MAHHFTEYSFSVDRPGHGAVGHRHSGGGSAELPRPGHSTPPSQLGQDVERSTNLHGNFSMAGHFSRPGHSLGRAGVQPVGGWAEGSAGSEIDRGKAIKGGNPGRNSSLWKKGGREGFIVRLRRIKKTNKIKI